MPLVSFYDRYINYSAEVVAKRSRNISTFEKRKNSLTNHITKKLSHDKNKHGIFQSNTWKWKKLIQETTHNTHWTNIHVLLENYIAYQNQTLSSEKLQDLLLSLKAQKTQMMVGFIANKYMKCLYVHYQNQLYIKIKAKRRKYCQDIVIKKREFCLINTVAFCLVEVKPKYVEAILIFIFSIVCFLLQYQLRIYFNIKLFFICGVFFSLSKIFATKKVASYKKFV